MNSIPTQGEYFMQILKGLVSVFLLVLTVFGCTRKSAFLATVTALRGQVFVERNGERTPLKKNDRLKNGDTLITGMDGVAAVSFAGNLGKFELQHNVEFVVRDFINAEKKLMLNKGNVWLLINKLRKKQSVNLYTPTTLAGVRGTQFYTFQMAGMQATCHCRGEVEYSHVKSSYKTVHKKDYLVFSKDDKLIVIYPHEFKALGLTHNHSLIDDSPLGKKTAPMPGETARKLKALIAKKFAEAK